MLDNIVEGALARAGGGHGSGSHSRTRRKSSSAGVFDSRGRKGSARAGAVAVAVAPAAAPAAAPEMRFKPSTVTTISVDRERAPSAQGRPLEWSDSARKAAAADNRRLPKLQIQAETTMLREVEGARSADASRSGSESSALRPGERPARASAESREQLLSADSGARRGRKCSVDQWGDVIGEGDEEVPPHERSWVARDSGELPPPPVPAKLAGDKAPRVELP